MLNDIKLEPVTDGTDWYDPGMSQQHPPLNDEPDHPDEEGKDHAA